MEGLAGGAFVGGHQGNGVAFITSLAHAHLDGDLRQQWHAQALGLALAAALAKDRVGLAVVRAEEEAHVLHQAEDRHIDLAEHGRGLARVD